MVDAAPMASYVPKGKKSSSMPKRSHGDTYKKKKPPKPKKK